MYSCLSCTVTHYQLPIQTHSCGFGEEIKYVANYDGGLLSGSSHHQMISDSYLHSKGTCTCQVTLFASCETCIHGNCGYFFQPLFVYVQATQVHIKPARSLVPRVEGGVWVRDRPVRSLVPRVEGGVWVRD